MIIDKFLIIKNKQTSKMLRILIHGENHFSLPLNALTITFPSSSLKYYALDEPCFEEVLYVLIICISNLSELYF